MAIGHNLISCDDLLYPSMFNRHHVSLGSAYGLTVEFDTLPDKYYVIERNNQMFFPYPSIFGDGAFLTITLNSVKINNTEICSSPVIIVETTTGITGGGAIPPVFPTDYNGSTLLNAEYIPGSTYKKGLTDEIQNLIDNCNIQSILVKRTTNQSPTVGGVSNSFSNFCIQKREVDVVEIEYEVLYHPAIGSEYTSVVTAKFDATNASYKVDGIETQIAGYDATDYVTYDSALTLVPFSFKTFTETTCPCELCDNCFILTSCSDSSVFFQSYSDLSTYVGEVVELEEMDGCWKVSECQDKIAVTVKDSYVSCKSCQPKCITPNCR